MRKLLLISTCLVLPCLASTPVAGQPAFLVRDINTLELSRGLSAPHQLFAALGKVFFNASLPGSSEEVWVSDGTTSGTEMLVDSCPGECPGGGRFWGSARGLVFWLSAGDVWRSDGTRAGTYSLTTGAPSVRSAGRRGPGYAFVGDFLYFHRCSPDNGCELWRTDGSIGGTQLVKEIPGVGLELDFLTAFRGKLYFLETTQNDLWVSDGTAEGTFRLTFASEKLFAATPSHLFFISGTELWTSDGTAAGTRSLTQFNTFNSFENTPWLKVIGNRIYFVADDGAHGPEIWRSDGTPEGTTRVTDLASATPSLDPAQLEELGSRLIFAAQEGFQPQHLWATDGSPDSTRLLSSVCIGFCQSATSGSPLVKVGDRIVFRARDDKGAELWSSNGTAPGTLRLTDVCPGSCDGALSNPKPLLGAAFFVAPDASGGWQLWRSDGTSAGSRPQTQLPAGIVLGGDDLVALGGSVVFNARSLAIDDSQLWISDGQPGGTRLVMEPSHGTFPSVPHDLTAHQGEIRFAACQGHDIQVWRSTGSPESTRPSTAFGPSAFCSDRPPNHLVSAGGALFFLKPDVTGREQLWKADESASDGAVQLTHLDTLVFSAVPYFAELRGKLLFPLFGSHGPEVWTSDGTPQGTGKAFDAPLGFENPATLGDEVFFVARDAGQVAQVWQSDGTAAGIRQLTSFTDSVANPEFTRIGPQVYFIGWGGFNASQIWKTDGTPAGTVQVSGDFPLFGEGQPTDLTSHQGVLYFLAHTPSGELGLWRSTGSADGTSLVQELPGVNRSNPGKTAFTSVAGQLFFVLNDAAHGDELWRSDGTPEGTRLVRDIVPGPIGSHPTGLVAAGNLLFFSAGDAVHGVELWQSDGTAAGTRLVHDIAPQGSSSTPQELTVVGNRLFFTADDGLYGRELWVLPLSAPGTCQTSPTALCLNQGRFRIEAFWSDFSGHTGQGQAVTLTMDTGYFWFFDPANVEAILKVLDGQGVNGHFWIFYGALSNVEYTLTVTDTQTGLTRRYHNASGQFASVGDVDGFGPLGAFSIAGDAPQAGPARAIRNLLEGEVAPCQPAATRLCLNGGRFAVEATWKDFAGRTGTAQAVGLTADTGYFTFFSGTNVEVVLKVLDGRPVNGRFWVFYGALSNVEYTILVTDTVTGTTKVYTNPQGVFASLGDTAAF